MEAKDEVWAMLPRAERSESIPISQNTMPSGEVVQSNPVAIEAQFILTVEAIRSCNVEELATQMDNLADQSLSVVMPHFFEMLSRTSQAAGTSMDCGGQLFGFDLYLASLEKIEIRFNPNGEAELPSLITSPQMAKYLSSLPPFTPAQQKLVDDLIEKKRKEHYARRRHRKLR